MSLEETRSIEQLPVATAVSPDALTVVQEPGGVAQQLAIRQLLGRLISTDESSETEEDLQDLLDYPANSIGLVFADADPAKNGWYRKTGASGAGNWVQFEKLSDYAAARITGLVTAAEAARTAAELVLAQTLLAALTGPPFATPAAGLAAVAEGATFFATDGGVVRYYTKTAGAAVVTPFLFGADRMVASMPALNGGGNSSKVALEFVPPAGMINSIGGNDAVPSLLFNNIIRWTSGPVSQPNYFDTITGLGVNITPSLTRSNTSVTAGIGAGAFYIESAFVQPGGGSGTSKAVEFNWDVIFTNESRARPLSIYAPADLTEYGQYSVVGIQAAIFNINDGELNQRIKMDFPTGKIVMTGPGTGVDGHPLFTFFTNNRVVAEQQNAAGTAFLPLWYRDNFDNMYMNGGGIYAVLETKETPFGGGAAKAAISWNVPVGAAEQAVEQVFGPAVEGDFYSYRYQGAATGRLIDQLYNNGTGATIVELQGLTGNGNDLLTSYAVAGGTSWTTGVDNSDGDCFVVEASFRTTGDATQQFFKCNPINGVTLFLKPPRLIPRTFATLPAAGTVGPGSLAYCTDLNSTVAWSNAAGGGANKGLLMAVDGNWKIMTAGA